MLRTVEGAGPGGMNRITTRWVSHALQHQIVHDDTQSPNYPFQIAGAGTTPPPDPVEAAIRFKHIAAEAISVGELFKVGQKITIVGRYDDSATGEELALWVNKNKYTAPAASDLQSGGATRVGTNTLGTLEFANAVFGPVLLFPSSLDDSEIIDVISGTIETEKPWWLTPALGTAMAI
jgi:hypothetical protein